MFTWSLYSDLQLQFTRNRLHYALQTVGASICRRFQRVGVKGWQPPPSAAPSLFIDPSLRRHALTEGCLYIICPIQFLISCFRMIVGQFDLGTDWTGSLSWSLPAYSFVPRLRLSCGSGSAAAMVPGVVHGAIPLSLELTAVVACVQ